MKLRGLTVIQTAAMEIIDDLATACDVTEPSVVKTEHRFSFRTLQLAVHGLLERKLGLVKEVVARRLGNAGITPEHIVLIINQDMEHLLTKYTLSGTPEVQT